jgi:hypothetical protein
MTIAQVIGVLNRSSRPTGGIREKIFTPVGTATYLVAATK